jgi:hypothetical protein
VSGREDSSRPLTDRGPRRHCPSTVELFAQRPNQEKADVFQETAARLGIGRAAIVEKDFWVCWALLQLREFFDQTSARAISSALVSPAGLIFKGGTSLSKVYGVIQRFSEDIDLTLDRDILGLGTDDDPDAADLSNKQRQRRIENLQAICAGYVTEVIAPLLETRIRALDSTLRVLPVAGDQQTLRLEYPRALDTSYYADVAYVKTGILLEFGARGELWPAHSALVTAFVAEQFPSLFSTAAAKVNVLDLARTLWEKAMILHRIAHAGVSPTRDRVSRHYYDLSKIVRSEQGRSALKDRDLCAAVRNHTMRYFAGAAARYDLAMPGTFRLIPSDATIEVLKKDHSAMTEMYFGVVPAFDQILDELRIAEQAIND